MKTKSSVIYNLWTIIILASFILTTTGCAIRSYPLAKDRVDQNLSEGNHGFLKGNIPAAVENKDRKTTRMTRVVEIELGLAAKAKKAKIYRHSGSAPEQSGMKEEESKAEILRGVYTERNERAQDDAVPLETFTKYTVEKNDTLQKISQKFYNTTKKWLKIYEDNKDVLKGPNKVYPGQVLKIAQESIAEIKENLK